MDKYLSGKYGFSALRDNENFYYNNYKQGVFRPIKAIISRFNTKTQFYVGKDENTPFISFMLAWILYVSPPFFL
ncbi:MAG: hypothetical protein B6D37_06435, partial [Sphingobacteriales bacterium UTBCD1]